MLVAVGIMLLGICSAVFAARGSGSSLDIRLSRKDLRAGYGVHARLWYLGRHIYLAQP